GGGDQGLVEGGAAGVADLGGQVLIPAAGASVGGTGASVGGTGTDVETSVKEQPGPADGSYARCGGQFGEPTAHPGEAGAGAGNLAPAVVTGAHVEAVGRLPNPVPCAVGAAVERNAHAEHAGGHGERQQDQGGLGGPAADVAPGQVGGQPGGAHQCSPPRGPCPPLWARPAMSANSALDEPASRRGWATMAPARLVSRPAAGRAPPASLPTLAPPS